LNTGQFWKTSTNVLPLWAAAAAMTTPMWAPSTSMERATKVAPAPSASAGALNG